MRDLPPTPTLRAFEAAARHATFTAASAELNVTQSAVSHQIQHLESLWGLRLFDRQGRLALTPAGEALAPIVRQFLTSLEATLAGLRQRRARSPLRVSLTHSFALRWLLPRMPSLEADHPDVELWIETSDDVISFGTDEADVAVRLGAGRYSGLYSELLLQEFIFPVASPNLLSRSAAIETPTDILKLPLLHRTGSDVVPKWEFWFERAGVDVALTHTGTRYPDTNMTIEAALAGHGAALVRSGHVEQELRDGRLVRLSGVRYPSPLAYYFVCPRGRETVPVIATFKDWLVRQAAEAQHLYNRT